MSDRYTIDIADRAPRPHPFQKAGIRIALEAVLAEVMPTTEVEVSVSLVGDRRMRQLNRDHRGKDKTTDVLSFPLEADLRPVIEGRMSAPDFIALGDIVISPKVCIAQAADWGWTPAERMSQLLLHGLLHLLGYDHEVESELQEMEAKEEALFAILETRQLLSGIVKA